ncbi:MAG: glycosyl transferase family 1 [Phycisphaerae bacterium SM23_33]|nr:MAG: glycosyl transferase family 1 [Phycisphaerae bacterium SM23_33]
MAQKNQFDRKEIIFVADYLPRQCGIATFTHDLCTAVAHEADDSYRCGVVAINDIPEGYRYSETVRFEVRESVLSDYRQAAAFINISNTAVVCLQHEYGIFGGPHGSHVLALLQRLRRPVVTTLHTVLKEPNENQKLVLAEICRLSSRVIVMAQRAREFLTEIYGVDAEKISMIPHGIPDVPFIDPAFYKDKFGVEGRMLILTSGLLSPGKGVEDAIRALPAVVAKHPNVVYMIVGATHPHVRRHSGEEYRNSLHRLSRELNVEEHVMFQNRFVEPAELCEFLGAADIYVTPYLKQAQIVSGMLAYALGSGNATISTPYWYAEEMLADDRGRLVPFQDPQAIAEQVCELLANDVRRDTLRKRAYQFTRNMVWTQVGKRYLEVYEEVQRSSVHPVMLMVPSAKPTAPVAAELPEIDLRHLRTLTDQTGILQHCLYATPDRRHGYTTDDNARALIVASLYWHQTRDEAILPLLQTYLSFLAHALEHDSGQFRNYMNYDRRWAEIIGSEDSHCRALWGLGMCVGLCNYEPVVGLATRLFERALTAVQSFVSPRAWAFAIVGIHAYLQRFSGDSEARRYRSLLAERIHRNFQEYMTDDWPWCEEVVTYANAKLPHALLMAGKWTFQSKMIEIGERALKWLLEVQTGQDGCLSVVGNQGWFPRDGKRARFDQQPIEAQALIGACVEAYNVTGNPYWLEQARRCFNWFLGDNDLKAPLYDFTTAGCRDGLHAEGASHNQGAESTLAWLISLLLMHEIQTQQTLGEPAADKEMESEFGKELPAEQPLPGDGSRTG